MDTYVPTTTSSGILGGQTEDGELDGIQAWKKNMKEKEQKEKDKEMLANSKTSNGPSKSGVDEIQLFKMMMKQEQTDGEPDNIAHAPTSGLYRLSLR